MNRTIKRFFGMVLLLAALWTPAFASGQQQEEADGTVDLRVAWWGATGRDEKYLAIIEEYESRNPNISITPEYQGWADYWGKMATMVAARNLPDVHQYTNNQLGEYAAKGAVVSLEPYIDSGVIDLDNWNMTMVDSGRIDGDLVAVTIGVTGPSAIFNVTWAEELGIPVPAFDAQFTWDEFQEYLQTEVNPRLPDGAYAHGDFGTAENYFWTWIRQNDADWLDSAGNYAVSAEVLAGWYGLLEDMRDAGSVPPLAFTVEDNTKARGDNAFNRRMMLIRPTNANQAKLEQAYMAFEGDRVELRRLPMLTGLDNPRECLITSALAIAANSDNPDASAEYINYFINDAEAQTIYNGEIGVPGSYTIQEMLLPNLDTVAAQEFEYINLITSGGVPGTDPKPAGIWAFDAEIQQMNQRVAAGDLTPAEAAEAIIERANTFLDSLE